MDKKLYVGCDCGCGEGVVFRAHRGSVYAEFSSFGFYREQGRFLSALRKDIDALKGNPLTSFMVAEDDLKAVCEFLKTAEYEEDHCENDGHISFSWDRDFGYIVDLYSRQCKRDILAGKRYRAYVLYIGKSDAEKLVKQIETVLSVKKVFS